MLLRRLIDQIARLVRALHQRHLSHRDLKAANLLIAPAEQQSGTSHGATEDSAIPRPWLIDLVGVSRHRKLGRWRRLQNLCRLNASFHQSRVVTRTDRLRFLRVYLQWGLRGKGGWKRWWQQIEKATQAKVARNLRNGRPLA